MSSKVNLEAMDELKLKYVTRLGACKLEELLASLPAEQSPELWDRTQVMEIVREGKRYVIAGGSWRQQRDQQRRQARLSKAENELKRLAAVQRKKVNSQKLLARWDARCNGSKPINTLTMLWTQTVNCNGAAGPR